jgi:hypothetical protein
VVVGSATGAAVVVDEVEVVVVLELVEPPRPVKGAAAKALAGSASAATVASARAQARIGSRRSLIAPNISSGGP